jgi:hypothetical protein
LVNERRERDTLLARLNTLETELNVHHESMRAADDATGLSYRAMLNELIALAQQKMPMALPMLRSWLGACGGTTSGEREETIASLAPLWLRARYEESPLSVMLQFSADDTVVAALKEVLAAFSDAEHRRDDIQRSHHSSFELSDPAPYFSWLEQHDRRFQSASDEVFTNAGHWTKLFMGGPDTAPIGPSLMTSLEGAVTTATKLSDAHCDPGLLSKGAGLPNDQLAHWLLAATRATESVSFRGRLSVPRWLTRRRFRGWLKTLGVDATEPGMRAMQSAIALEAKLRPVRHILESIRRQLGMADGRRLMLAQELDAEARTLLGALRMVHDLVRAALAFPLAGLLVDVLRQGRRDAYAAFRRDLDSAFRRQSARAASLAALEGVAPWFEPAWLVVRRANIVGAQPPLGGFDAIEGALPTLDAFQQFRTRASRLGPEDLRIFAAFHTKRSTLESLAADQIGPVVRRTLVREALLGWKERLEREHPSLLLQREEIEQKVERLAEIDTALRVKNRTVLACDIDTSSLGTSSAWEDITRLRGPRALRLREILDRGADIGLLSLRPVWLMNPDTASRLLPLREKFFDVVIFDEASQMLVEHATPALFRAGRVLVSGDDKQMPPTSFFRGRADNDEDEEFDGSELEDDVSDAEREIFEETWNRREIKDCPDLLALGSSCLPTTTLQIHYRSKYRELIDFSNAAFYEARLSVPARHPQAEILRVRPVEVIRVEGIYTAQTNAAEADRVVGALADLWASPPDECRASASSPSTVSRRT